MTLTSGITTDTFFNGRVQVVQASQGYRFSIDAILLAAAVQPKPGERLLDLGTGCGIIPLILAFRNPAVRIHGVEVQADLVKLAQMNVAGNHMHKQITILQTDMRLLTAKALGGPMDWVVSNPPYRRPNSGRINPNAQRALARHEIKLNLIELLQTVRRMLRTGGGFMVIYPGERVADLFFEMRSAGIEPKRLRCIHSNSEAGAKLVLVKGVTGARPGLSIEEPLVLYNKDGSYTRAVQTMMNP